MAITIKATYETEIFINKPGYLTIKQQDSIGNEPEVVMLSPEQARAVIDEMERLLKLQDQWWQSTSEVEDELESPG